MSNSRVSILMTGVFALVLFFLALSGQAWPAELRPYPPPPNQAPNRPWEQRYDQTEEQLYDQTEDFYEQFRRKADDLSVEEREELKKKLEMRIDEAYSNSQWNEVRHYIRLIEILEGKREG
jgi:hypothetical protein